MARKVSLRLTDGEVTVLESLGGVTQGVKFLIEEYRKRLLEIDKEKTPEEAFYDVVLLPGEVPLRETYCAFLERYIREGGRSGSIDYYINPICGETGFDTQTVRKHFRKLVSRGFIKSEGFLFRPTIRIKKGVDPQLFVDKILPEFLKFIRSEEVYEDVLSGI